MIHLCIRTHDTPRPDASAAGAQPGCRPRAIQIHQRLSSRGAPGEISTTKRGCSRQAWAKTSSARRVPSGRADAWGAD
eukprot:scaffold3275_cov385-Prasinococcus_capsulatus_cf.AAC.12